MGLLNTIKSVFTKEADTNRLRSALVPMWGEGREVAQPTNFQSLVEAYQDWVYVCASKNAQSVASVPLRLYVAKASKGKSLVRTKAITKERFDYLSGNPGLTDYIRKAVEIEEVLEHPFLVLMKNVNPFLNKFDLQELTGLYQELTGNSYWYIVENALGLPAEIWPVPAQKMRIVPSKEKFISGYIYQTGIGKVPFDEEEIIHFKFPSPTNVFYGMSPLAAMANTYNISYNMDKYENALFSNMARPEGTLETDDSLNDAEFKRLKEEWHETYGGIEKAGKTALLEKGVKYKTIALTPKEMSFLMGRKITMGKIAGAYGIPVSKLTTENVNLANAKVGEMQYQKDTILPRLRRREEKINEKLLPRYDEKLFCAYDNPVPDDLEYRLKERESNLKTGYSSINQELQRDGREMVPWGAVPYLPMSLMPVTSSGEKSKAMIKDIAKDIAKAIVKEPEDKEAVRKRKWEIFVKTTSAWERKMADKMRELFQEQEKEVLANMKKTPKAIVSKDIIGSWLFGLAAWRKRFEKKGRPIIKGVMVETGVRELNDLVAGVSFDVDAPEVIAFMDEYVPKFSFEVNKKTLDSLREELQEGITAGEGIPILKNRVKKVFDFAENYRNKRIARSEIIRASNAGAEEAYKQSEVVEGKEWLTAFDERTCEECSSMDGRTASLGQTFGIKDIDLDFDYTEGEMPYPPLHPLCRCTIVPVLKGG